MENIFNAVVFESTPEGLVCVAGTARYVWDRKAESLTDLNIWLAPKGVFATFDVNAGTRVEGEGISLFQINPAEYQPPQDWGGILVPGGYALTRAYEIVQGEQVRSEAYMLVCMQDAIRTEAQYLMRCELVGRLKELGFNGQIAIDVVYDFGSRVAPSAVNIAYIWRAEWGSQPLSELLNELREFKRVSASIPQWSSYITQMGLSDPAVREDDILKLVGAVLLLLEHGLPDPRPVDAV